METSIYSITPNSGLTEIWEHLEDFDGIKDEYKDLLSATLQCYSMIFITFNDENPPEWITKFLEDNSSVDLEIIGNKIMTETFFFISEEDIPIEELPSPLFAVRCLCSLSGDYKELKKTYEDEEEIIEQMANKLFDKFRS